MRFRVARSAGLIALALLSFGAVSTAVRSLVPWPNDYFIRDKLEYFAEHKDEYDVVYIGSSTTDRSFRPSVIDPLLRARGWPLRSFNFGAGGMDAFAMDALLTEILALESASLRWVVLEWSPWNPLTANEQELTRRVVHWHTPGITWTALRALALMPNLETGRFLDVAVRHSALFAHWLGNYGEAPHVFEELLGAEPVLSLLELEAEGGYRLADEGGARFRVVRRHFEEHASAYLRKVRALRDDRHRRTDLARYHLAGLQAQLARVRAAGAEPVLVITPDILARPLAFRLQETGALPTLLAFNDPDTYPDIYQMEMRIDANHLNRAGATRFSELFSEAFVQVLGGP